MLPYTSKLHILYAQFISIWFVNLMLQYMRRWFVCDNSDKQLKLYDKTASKQKTMNIQMTNKNDSGFKFLDFGFCSLEKTDKHSADWHHMYPQFNTISPIPAC